MTALTVTTQTAASGVMPVRPVEVLAPEGVVLVLRTLVDSDREEFIRHLHASRWHLRRWFPTAERGETEDAYFDRQVRRAAEGNADGSAWRRAAFDDAGRFVGVVNVNRIVRGLDWQADMCWWVSAKRAGRGLGTQIVRAAVEHALADLPQGLGLTKVHAGIHPKNKASVALAKRLGFKLDPRYASRLLVGGVWQAHDAWVKTVDLGGDLG